MKVVEGVHKVDGVRGGNAYLVETLDGLMAVDTGMPGNATRIVEYVRGLGRQPAELRRIVLTHCDLDHTGSVAELTQLTGAQVAIHRLDAPVLEGEGRPQKGGLVMRALFKVFRFRPVRPDVLLEEGDTIGGFRVLHTPGHTLGSITLVREDGVVFSGDAMLSDRRGDPQPPSESLSRDRASASVSAARVEALQPRVLLTGHGAPVLGR